MTVINWGTPFVPSRKRFIQLLMCPLGLLACSSVRAELVTGIWANYRYVLEDSGIAADRDSKTLGDIQGEALVFLMDDKREGTQWSFSGEMRFGPGSFTDPYNNSSGDNYLLHKAWLGYQVNDTSQVKIGKSQVPFGWKTVNFWPGDLLQGGYGDQMDVGVKFSREGGSFNYDLAYFHADDWGETSTDTADDNRHWGSSTSYRKVQTVVANVLVPLTPHHQLGVSAQAGNLQDLTGIDPLNPIDGSHQGAVLYYLGAFDRFNLKAEVMRVGRTLPRDYAADANLQRESENSRAAVELGYTSGDWYWYLDASWAEPDKQTDTTVGTVSALAPGVRYDYGPGWFYFEALTQDGWIGRDGDIGKGNFSAIYVTADYYF